MDMRLRSGLVALVGEHLAPDGARRDAAGGDDDDNGDWDDLCV